MSRHRYIKPKYLVIIPLLLALVIALACGANPTPTPTTGPTATAVPPTPTAPPDATPTPTTAGVAPAATSTPRPTAITDATPTPIIKPPTPTPTAAPLASPTPTRTPIPVKIGVQGGNFTVLTFVHHTFWDPHDNPSLPHESLFFSQLLEFNPLNPQEVIPDLAKSWKFNEDGKEVTFELNDAVWHDGKKVTAEDVVFSLNRMVDPDATRPLTSALRQSYDRSEAVDENTVKVFLKFASATFIPFVAVDHMKLLPKHVYDDEDFDSKLFKNVIGSGPFKPVSQVRGNSFLGERHPDYHKEGRPFFNTITYLGITDAGTAAAAFKVGRILGTTCCTALGVDDALALGEELKGRYSVSFTPLTNSQYFFANLDIPPWNNLKVVKALKLATDLQEFKDAFGSRRWDIGTPFLKDSWWSNPFDEIVKNPGWGGVPGSPRTKQQDIDDAIALLKELDYWPVQKLNDASPIAKGGTFQIISGNNVYQRDPAILWAEQMRRNLGMDIEAKILDRPAQTRLTRGRELDFGTSGYGVMVADPEDYLNTIYGATGRNSILANWKNEQFETWIAEQARLQDFEERKALLRKMEKYLIEVEDPYITWTWTPLFFIMSDKIRTAAGKYRAPDTIRTILKWEHIWLEE